MLVQKTHLKYVRAKKSNRSRWSSQIINATIDEPTLPASVSPTFLNASFLPDNCVSAAASGEALLGGDGELSVCLPCSHDSCACTFASVSALNLHNYNVHGLPGLFQCLICESRFASFQLTEGHVMSQHTDNCLRCYACFLSCDTYNHLKAHIRLHVAEDPQQCVLCPLTYTKCSDLALHIAFHRQCGAAYRPANFSFCCTTCNHSFASNRGLIDHLRMQHSYSSIFVCIYCGLCFATLESQRKHHQLCIPGGVCAGTSTEMKMTFQCRYCAESFETSAQVKHHQTMHRFKCSSCDFETNRYNILASHSRLHNLLPKCKCKVCDEEFPKRRALELHLKEMHVGEMKFLCEFCGKRFLAKRDLTLHTKSHSKSFRCLFPRCAATFGTSSDLQRHQRRHLNETPYRCEYCGKSFNQHSTLKMHIRVIHTACK